MALKRRQPTKTIAGGYERGLGGQKTGRKVKEEEGKGTDTWLQCIGFCPRDVSESWRRLMMSLWFERRTCHKWPKGLMQSVAASKA